MMTMMIMMLMMMFLMRAMVTMEPEQVGMFLIIMMTMMFLMITMVTIQWNLDKWARGFVHHCPGICCQGSCKDHRWHHHHHDRKTWHSQTLLPSPSSKSLSHSSSLSLSPLMQYHQRSYKDNHWHHQDYHHDNYHHLHLIEKLDPDLQWHWQTWGKHIKMATFRLKPCESRTT